jgi:hypothetical protein
MVSPLAGSFSEEFAAVVRRIHAARAGTGFIAHIDMYPIVPVDRFPAGAPAMKACAARLYREWDPRGKVTGLTSTDRADRWRRALIDHVSTNPFDHLSARSCAEAARLGGVLADLIAAELGDVRSAAIVEYHPSKWYAAKWTDWLLVTTGRATILHLGWDS